MKTTTKNNQPTRASQKKPKTDEQLTFLEHVYELRSRLFWIIGTLLVASAVAFQFKDALVRCIMMPLDGQKLIYLTPGGGFSFIFTLCLYVGAFLTIPVVVYHLYRFLQPMIGRTSRRLVASLMLISGFLACTGAAFGYVVAIPAAIQFLTGFAGDAVSASLTAESYLSFVMAYMFGLAALFQLPLLVFMFDHIQKFPPGTLFMMQRFVVLGAVVAAAIITPTPDIVNQMIIAGPIIVVYQFGVVAVWVRRRHEKNARKELVTRTVEAVPVIESIPIVREVAPAKIQTASLQSEPRQQVKRRSVDGFVRVASLPASPLPISATKPSPVFERSRRSLRSLDGFSIV